MIPDITLTIQLAPNVETLLNKLIAALTPKNFTGGQQVPPPSPAEQAARMRMQQAPAPMQPAPTYDPRNPMPQSVSQMYPQMPVNPAPAVPTANPRQYRPQPVNPTPTPAMTAPVRPAPPAGPLTAQPAAAPSNPVPTAAAPAYEQDQLARATATLADAGKMQQIQALFQQFQIQQLTQLPKERYGEYATALRGLGVRI